MGNGVSQLLALLDESYLDDAAGAMIPDCIALSLLRRAEEDVHKFCAKFRFILARPQFRLMDPLPAALVPAQLLGAEMLSNANRKLVLSSVRADLGKVDFAMHATRRILSRPG